MPLNILCCVKRVPMTGGRIVLTADEQAIETRHLGFTISPHEECGVEPATATVTGYCSPRYSTSSFVPTLATSGGR